MNESAATIPAVIMAGGKAKPDIVEATGISNRAMIPVNGRPMLSYVVDALQKARSIERITVVGDLEDSAAYQRVDDQGGFVENLFGLFKIEIIN